MGGRPSGATPRRLSAQPPGRDRSALGEALTGRVAARPNGNGAEKDN
ncbi:hypothetical protein ACQB60_23600 [Actinomycetota bacterium Odt1-20B]